MEYGLFGAGALVEWRRTHWLSAVMLILVWAIVLCGVLIGPLPGEGFGLGGDVIPQAHLYGLTCGMGFVLVHHAYTRIRT